MILTAGLVKGNRVLCGVELIWVPCLRPGVSICLCNSFERMRSARVAGMATPSRGHGTRHPCYQNFHQGRRRSAIPPLAEVCGEAIGSLRGFSE